MRTSRLISRCFLFLILLLYSQFCILVCAQKSRASKKQSSPDFTSSAFDPTIERLPTRFLGNSLASLINPLTAQRKRWNKSEFETTAEYQARVAALRRSSLIGSLSYESLLAFSIGRHEQLSATYDADLTLLTVELKFETAYMVGSYSDRYYQLTWADTSQRVTSYIGRTAFNRRARVSVYRNNTYYLAMRLNDLKGISEVKDNYPLGGTLTVTFMMPPNEARQFKANLRALVIGHLADNPYDDSYENDTPEIDDPYDRHNFSYFFKIIPQEIWFYDISSGMIYAKLSTEEN